MVKSFENAEPNDAHYAIAKLQEVFPDTHIITQNIDNLHERAGSKHVLHLHGEITKLRSQKDPDALVNLNGWEQHYGDLHPDGSILRPHIVFFGEDVPNFPLACEIASQADIMIVVGTSLNVYPAASLLMYYLASNDSQYIFLAGVGVVLDVVGTGLFIASIPVNCVGKNQITDSYDMYNDFVKSKNNDLSLNFGICPSGGVGISLHF